MKPCYKHLLRLAAMFFILETPWQAVAQGTYQVAALTGMPAPGTEENVTFGGAAGSNRVFTFAAINQRGELVIQASLSGAQKNTGQGLWMAVPGSLRLLVRSGQKLPGQESRDLVNLMVPHVSDSGAIVFCSRISGNVHPVPAVLLMSGEQLYPIAISGEPAPGAPGVTYGEKLSCSAMNSIGQVALFDEKPKADGIWVGTAGDLQPSARSGDPAPGVGQDVFFERLNPPQMNAGGRIVFSARLRGKGVTESNNSGIWTGQPGDLTLLVSEGDATPGKDGVFGDLSRIGSRETADLAVNGAGQIVFFANKGIWMGTPGSLHLVVRDGDTMGKEQKGPKVSFNRTPTLRLQEDGRLMFWSEQAIWQWQAEGLRMIARRGDPAPGTDGLAFDGFSEVLQTPAGRLAFIATLKNKKGRGLWVGVPDEMQCVVREEEEFILASGDSRRIVPGSLALTSDGCDAAGQTCLPLNDNGEVVFRLAFEAVRGVRDRSEGVFVAKAQK